MRSSFKGRARGLWWDVYIPLLRRGACTESSRLTVGLNGFDSENLQLEDQEALSRVFSSFKPNVVMHLAIQAGVRYSIEKSEANVS